MYFESLTTLLVGAQGYLRVVLIFILLIDLLINLVNLSRCLIIFHTILSIQRIKFHHGWKCGLKSNTKGE